MPSTGHAAGCRNGQADGAAGTRADPVALKPVVVTLEPATATTAAKATTAAMVPAAAGRAPGGLARLAEVDWSAPWLSAVADEARPIDWRVPHAALAMLNERAAVRCLATASGRAVRFADADLLEAAPYERQIALTGQVPTRLRGDGYVHDALSALVWLSFPRTKAALNALQAAEIARAGIGPRRGRLRDAATLFDENALLLAVAPGAPRVGATVAALRERRWHAALVDARAVWHASIVPVAFGHALMQRLLVPFATITAHAWVIEVPADWFGWAGSERRAWLDTAVAVQIGPILSSRAARLPLPVLGIPGWWPPNEQPGFYDDARVFRPAIQAAVAADPAATGAVERDDALRAVIGEDACQGVSENGASSAVVHDTVQ